MILHQLPGKFSIICKHCDNLFSLIFVILVAMRFGDGHESNVWTGIFMKVTNRTVSLSLYENVWLFFIHVHCSIAQFIVKGAFLFESVKEYLVLFKNLIIQYCNILNPNLRTYNLVEVSIGIILRVSRLEVSVYIQCLQYKPVSNHFCSGGGGGGGVKSVSRCDCE